MAAQGDFDRVALVDNPYASAVGETSIAAVTERSRPTPTSTSCAPRARTTRWSRARPLPRLDAVIVYSGDGGFNEALNGLDEDIPIGFLPAAGPACSRGRSGSAGRSRRSPDGRCRARGRPHVAHLPGARERAALRVPRDRARRRSSGGWRARARLEGAGRTTSLSRGRRRRRSPSAAVGSSPPSRWRAPEPRRSRWSPTAIRTRTSARSHCTSRRRAVRARARPRCSERRHAGLRAPIPRLPVLGGGQTETPDVLYRHDADRFEIRCSLRCRSRWTARTSATSSTRRSRRSATPSPCSCPERPGPKPLTETRSSSSKVAR